MSKRLLGLFTNFAVQHCGLNRQLVTNTPSFFKNNTTKIPQGTTLSHGRPQQLQEFVVSGNNSKRVSLSQSPQELLVQNAANRAEPLTPTEWASLRQEAQSCHGPITPKALDVYLMSQCTKSCNLKSGLSFLKHLETLPSGPNLATLGAFFRLWHACGGHYEETELLSRYDKLRKQYPLLDAGTAESAAMALSCTTRWKEAFGILDMIKLTHHPKSAVYTSLAAAAFRHGCFELGYSMMEELFERGNRRPGPEAYLAWLQHNEPEGLLHFIATHGDKPPEKVSQALSQSMRLKETFQTNFTTINKRGRCQACGRQLMPQLPTPTEFKRLQTAMMDQVLLSGNVFLKTSPQEVVNFQEMLKRSKTWDVVIDGLNVAFACGSISTVGQAKLLLLIVEHFQRRGKSMLILGRKHMKQWHKQQMMSISNSAQLFLADNLSQDDPLVILAALHSGLGTQVISRDLMRSHMFLLKDKELRNIFRRWQYSHQCFFEIQRGSRVVIQDPLPFHPFAQQHLDGSWHLPYEVVTSMEKKRYNHLEIPKHWLCLSKAQHIRSQNHQSTAENTLSTAEPALGH